MKIRMSCCLGVALSLGAAAALAAAQEPAAWLSRGLTARTETAAAPPLPLNDWRRLLDLPTGTELRVSLERARVLKGKVDNVTDEALTLRLPGARLEVVHSGQAVRVHRIQNDSLKNGTLIGLGIGAGVGAIVGAAQDPENTDMTRRGATLSGTMAGATFGSLLGLLADKARVELVLVFERSPQAD